MGVLLVFVVLVALTVTMAATLYTNHVMLRLWREQRREWRALPREECRRIMRVGLLISVPIVTVAIVVLIAPWGLRHTLTYLVILPAVVVVPVVTVVVGVRAARRLRR